MEKNDFTEQRLKKYKQDIKKLSEKIENGDIPLEYTMSAKNTLKGMKHLYKKWTRK